MEFNKKYMDLHNPWYGDILHVNSNDGNMGMITLNTMILIIRLVGVYKTILQLIIYGQDVSSILFQGISQLLSL